MKNLWAVEWLRWPGYGQFFGQMVREHMRQKKRQQYDMSCAIDPATEALVSGETAFADLPRTYAGILDHPGTLCHRVRYR